MRRLLLAGALALGGTGWAADEPVKAEAPEVAISKGVLCTAIADRQAADPEESGAEYEASVERIYFWNAATVAHPPQTVTHVWTKDGKKVAEVALELKHGRTRTWSSKKIASGAWKVETVTPDGTVLAVAEFTVK
ncbi:MAG: DUF2914 domain-containing protein [Elusimicrobia bacterium]|nr:DUF2914 domain-containing protein [Elusimicrobiota bacterium]